MTAHEMLKRSAEQLQRQLRVHQELLTHALQDDAKPLRLDASVFVDCPHRRLLRQTLSEVIDVLDQTRKAFKSKQLEALRRKLIRVLAEHA